MSPHYSSLERMRITLKKQREKADKIQKPIDAEEKISAEKTTAEKIRILVWDWEHRQLSRNKYDYFLNLIDIRLKEDITEMEKKDLEKIKGCIRT